MYLSIYLAIFFPLMIIGIIVSVIPLHFHDDMAIADILMLTVHNFGFVFGVGAATILHAFDIFAKKNTQLKLSKPMVVNFLLKFAWLGLILMIIVHTLELLVLPNFIHGLKFFTIAVILVFYIYFSRLQKMKKSDQKSTVVSTQALSLAVLFFWYLDFFLNSIWLPALHL